MVVLNMQDSPCRATDTTRWQKWHAAALWECRDTSPHTLLLSALLRWAQPARDITLPPKRTAQATYPPQWSQLDLKSSLWHYLLSLRWWKRNSEPNGAQRERITSFRTYLPPAQPQGMISHHAPQHRESLYRGCAHGKYPTDTQIGGPEQRAVINQTNLHQVV